MADSAPNKLFPEQKGFPTPNSAPESLVCRTLMLPASEEYLALAMGALDALRHPYNWYINGDLNEQQAADVFAEILDKAYELALTGKCQPDVPTPFWDTSADSDDVADYELQDWYGVATVEYHSPPEVTFIDRIAIWAFAGFIAYAGQPGAAIAFLTIAPKFVIAFKTGDLGAIIDVIVDASHIASVDTYSVADGIKRITVIGDPELSTHQIYLVKDDNPDTVMQVIRSELKADDVTPDNVRYNTDEDVFQTSPDHGTTWIDNPDADPRTNVGYQLPARTGDDPRCDAAANMVAKLRSMIDFAVATATQVQMVSGLVGIIALFFPPIDLLIALVWAVASLIAFIGTEVVNGAFTEEVYARILCELYEQLDENGLMNQAGYNAFLAALFASDEGTVYNVAKAMLDQLGFVGLNNAGATGEETGDCSACVSACPCILFEGTEPYSVIAFGYSTTFENATVDSEFGNPSPSLTSGTGLDNVGNPGFGLAMEIDLTVDRYVVSVEFDRFFTRNDVDALYWHIQLLSASREVIVEPDGTVSGSEAGWIHQVEAFGDASVRYIRIYLAGSGADFETGGVWLDNVCVNCE